MTLSKQPHHSVVSPVVLRATELKDVVGAGRIPPGSCSFEPAMADHLVGALYRAAADVIASTPGRCIIEPVGAPCTFVEQRIVMLHTFLKQTQKTPASELAVARKRMKEVRADAHPCGNGRQDA